MTMFSELLNATTRLGVTITNRQAASERTILAAVNKVGKEQDALIELSIKFADLLWVRLDRTDLALAEALDALKTLAVAHVEQTEFLKQILAAVTLPPAVRAILALEIGGTTSEGEHIEMRAAQNQQGTLNVALKNATGGPGRADGVPTWKVAPDGVLELTPAEDGLSCSVKTLPLPADQPVQTAVVTFAADGDLGDGVTAIVATLAITVYDPASGAVVADITAGAFTDIAVG